MGSFFVAIYAPGHRLGSIFVAIYTPGHRLGSLFVVIYTLFVDWVQFLSLFTCLWLSKACFLINFQLKIASGRLSGSLGRLWLREAYFLINF